MNRLAVGLVLSILTTAPALAAHNNPWATPEDTVLGKNHDANQEQSMGRPGEDEMRGDMMQTDNGATERGGSGRGSGGSGAGDENGSGGGNRGGGHGGGHGR
ncbi:hypothetical protein [Roseovarius sp.]|uniref:hypothetical protein n=1 Tax=Roseovarius sp. TaxID=1486281 RepID=UPI003565AB46